MGKKHKKNFTPNTEPSKDIEVVPTVEPIEEAEAVQPLEQKKAPKKKEKSKILFATSIAAGKISLTYIENKAPKVVYLLPKQTIELPDRTHVREALNPFIKRGYIKISS